MPSAVRFSDVCTGHGCFGSRANIEGSPVSFINNLGIHTVGMSWMPHGCAGCPPHGGTQATGSPDTFEGNSPIARVGDGISCGSSNATGSLDTLIN